MSNDAGWNDEFLVGEEFIDGQHRELFSICRTIEELARSGKPVSKEDATSHLLHLFEEFRNHFEQEMHLFASVYHMAYMDHEQHHIDFMEKFWDILEESKKSTPDLMELMGFTKNWFANHILLTDLPQFKELRARGLEKSKDLHLDPRS